MGIEYQPPSLKTALTGPYGERRLRNREGTVVATQTTDGNEVWRAEGTIPQLHQQALEFLENNPDHTVTLESYSCSSLVIPPVFAANEQQIPESL